MGTAAGTGFGPRANTVKSPGQVDRAMRTRLHLAGTAALAAAVVLLFVLQFVPWTKYEMDQSFGGFDSGFPGGQFPAQEIHIEVFGYTWSVVGQFNGEEDKESWYSDEVDDADGLGAIRTAIPFLLVGLVLLGAALVLQVLRFGNAAGLGSAVGTLLVLVGTILMVAGQDAFFDGVDILWHAGLYVAIAAILAGGAGSVLAFLPPDEAGAAPPVRPVDFD